MLIQAHEEILRDRIVVGLFEDDTRHKLLAEQSLTLEKAVKICRAEEAATHTGDGMLPVGSINAARKSQYQRQKRFDDKPVSSTSSSISQSPAPPTKKCPQCGRSAYTKSACPAAHRKCNGCKATSHFEKLCPKKTKPVPSSNRIGQLKLQQATSGNQYTISVDAILNTDATGAAVEWIPDTGSDVDAIGLHHLQLLGGFSGNLADDYDIVTGVNGQQLTSVGQIRSSLVLGPKIHHTTLHVYPDLSDALLSRTSLSALGLLPNGWPTIHRIESKPATADTDIARIRTELLHEFADVFADEGPNPCLDHL